MSTMKWFSKTTEGKTKRPWVEKKNIVDSSVEDFNLSMESFNHMLSNESFEKDSNFLPEQSKTYQALNELRNEYHLENENLIYGNELWGSNLNECEYGHANKMKKEFLAIRSLEETNLETGDDDVQNFTEVEVDKDNQDIESLNNTIVEEKTFVVNHSNHITNNDEGQVNENISDTHETHFNKESTSDFLAVSSTPSSKNIINGIEDHYGEEDNSNTTKDNLPVQANEDVQDVEEEPSSVLSTSQEQLNEVDSSYATNEGIQSSYDTESYSGTPTFRLKQNYQLPFYLLEKGKHNFHVSNTVEIKETILKLESTLKQFNIDAKVVGIQKGPIVTRFEITIPPGIKVNKILGLSDEIAMGLEALKVRIEAPIPGRSTVGIEIPNRKRLIVHLGDIMNDTAYKDSEAHLPLIIGTDIAGNNVISDLTKLPHVLIAGATGAGKSVMVNSFIVNLILSRSPEEIRFLMVDPKLVELSCYNDIPHLLYPVITDHQKAILGLNWAVEEMERRYEDLAEIKVRDINSYNQKIKEEKINLPKMPFIIVLIDELGDLMMVAGKEVESSIIRLSQKARAVGIHLILATQRPSVDVITALIKANCPCRIALQVAQKTDSRTILDQNGAEQLLGQGDALFKHPSQAQLKRVQSPLVKDEEVENVVQEVKSFGKANYIFLENPKSKSQNLGEQDEALLEESWNIILESEKASASYLQRRLRIGYNKAARIIEALEDRGYIGPQIGAKPREIFKDTPG